MALKGSVVFRACLILADLVTDIICRSLERDAQDNTISLYFDL